MRSIIILLLATIPVMAQTGTTGQPVTIVGGGRQATVTVGNALKVDGSGSAITGTVTAIQAIGSNLHMVCDAGCGGAGAFADDSAFTGGSSSIANMGAVFNDGLAAVTSGNAAAPRITAQRGLHMNLRTVAGVEIPFPAALGANGGFKVEGVAGGTAVPISGTVTVTDGAGALNVIVDSGTVTANAGTNLNTSALATSANQTNKTQFTHISDGTDDALVSGTGSLQVTCDNCGAPSSFADNSAFTFGTSGITNIGAVVDDTATNTVTENSSGTPRMSTNRVLYVDVSKTTANTTAIKVDGSAVTQPVSGTVTANAGTGTFTVGDGAGALNVIVDSGAITTTPPANASTNVTQLAGTAVDVNSGSKSAGTLRVVLATDQPALTNKLLVTPDSVALPANQSVNVAQVGGTNTVTGGVAGIIAVGGNVANAGAATANPVPVGGIFTTTPATLTTGQTATLQFTAAQNAKYDLTTVAGTAADVNSGTKSAGTLRVVIATDQPALTNKLLVTPDSVALPANQSVNVAQVAGTTTDTNSGTKSAGTIRVVLATDQPALTNKLLVTPDSVALPANQSVNLNQIAGSAILTAATGSQKVGVTGNAGAAFDAANNAAAPANVVVDGFETATQTTTQPAAATAGNVRRGVARTDGVLYVVQGGPVMWSCGLSAIGTTLTQCQAAPGAGLRLYITDVVSQSNTATAGLFTLRFGTGSNCATGTGNLFFASASALMASPGNTVAVNHFHLVTPIAVTAANAVCVLGVVTNTTNIQINGYTAP